MNFVVVPQNAINVDIIIGESFFSQAEVVIRPTGVLIRKIQSEDDSFPLMRIGCVDTEPVLDIEEIASKEAKVAVAEAIQNYKPEKCKSINIEMNIVLENDIPISTRPRRLPLTERSTVDDQVEQWLKDGIRIGI